MGEGFVPRIFAASNRDGAVETAGGTKLCPRRDLAGRAVNRPRSWSLLDAPRGGPEPSQRSKPLSVPNCSTGRSGGSAASELPPRGSRNLWQRIRAAAPWLLASLGLAELLGQAWASQRAPDGLDWQGLEPAVVARVRAGKELVVVAPAWAQPQARQALGQALMPLSHIARPDESGFARALEISVLGQRAEALRGWVEESRERVGPFLLRQLTNPRPVPATYDFVDNLGPSAATVVTRGRSGRIEPCPHTRTAKVENGDLHGHPTFPRERFRCPGAGRWFFVGTTVIEDQAYRPRRCIWAHPSKYGPLTLRFPAVALGQRIVGHAGLPYFFERERRGAPVTLEVRVGGRRVGSVVHRDGEGWKRFEFSTPRSIASPAIVEFQVSTPKAWRREFCFEARAQ